MLFAEPGSDLRVNLITDGVLVTGGHFWRVGFSVRITQVKAVRIKIVSSLKSAGAKMLRNRELSNLRRLLTYAIQSEIVTPGLFFTIQLIHLQNVLQRPYFNKQIYVFMPIPKSKVNNHMRILSMDGRKLNIIFLRIDSLLHSSPKSRF